jgi:hypothetical protein
MVIMAAFNASVIYHLLFVKPQVLCVAPIVNTIMMVTSHPERLQLF